MLRPNIGDPNLCCLITRWCSAIPTIFPWSFHHPLRELCLLVHVGPPFASGSLSTSHFGEQTARQILLSRAYARRDRRFARFDYSVPDASQEVSI